MRQQTSRFSHWLGCAVVLCGLSATGLSQQGNAPLADPLGLGLNGPPRPLLTITMSGVERGLEDIAWMFKIAERPDMVDYLEDLIRDQARDLKGLDRTRPMGAMIFLQTSLPPRPVPVVYVPVADVNEMLKTLDLGPLKTRKVEGTENKFELVGRRMSQFLVLRDGYLFISQNEEFAESDELPIPANFAPPLTTKYDLAAKVDLTAMPPVLRDAFLGYLRSQSEADLQRRDNEPQAAYIARRTAGINTLENIEMFLTEAETLTIGLEASPNEERVTLDFSIDAKPGSTYAEYTRSFSGKPTAFSALVEDESQPLTMAASFLVNPRDKKAQKEYVRAFEVGLKDRLAQADGGTISPASEAMIARIIEPLRSTVEQGEMDFCFQFREVGPRKFVVIAAGRIVGGETLSTGLQQLLLRAQELDENLDNLDVNFAEIGGVSIHRLQAKEARRDNVGPFGSNPSAYVGVSGKTFWLAVGGPEAVDELEAAIDRQAISAGAATDTSRAPFKAVFRTSQWLKMAPEQARNNDQGLSVALDAFKASEDAVRVEVRPTDTGVRARVQFDRSFARFIAMMLAAQYDRTQL